MVLLITTCVLLAECSVDPEGLATPVPTKPMSEDALPLLLVVLPSSYIKVAVMLTETYPSALVISVFALLLSLWLNNLQMYS